MCRHWPACPHRASLVFTPLADVPVADQHAGMMTMCCSGDMVPYGRACSTLHCKRAHLCCWLTSCSHCTHSLRAACPCPCHRKVELAAAAQTGACCCSPGACCCSPGCTQTPLTVPHHSPLSLSVQRTMCFLMLKRIVPFFEPEKAWVQKSRPHCLCLGAHPYLPALAAARPHPWPCLSVPPAQPPHAAPGAQARGARGASGRATRGKMWRLLGRSGPLLARPPAWTARLARQSCLAGQTMHSCLGHQCNPVRA